jgi:hypothetical protein
MPAVSKKQQRFFGMVRAAQKGEGASSPEVAKVAASIKKKDAKDFASTKHKGLPEKKMKSFKEETEDSLRDKRMERGGVGGNQRYDRAPKAPNTKKFGSGKTALQKDMEKKHGKGKSAMDIVRAEIEAKHGKGALMKTKKEETEMQEGKKGLWDNIHAKRKRGEAPAKKGDKDYPKTLNVEHVDIFEEMSDWEVSLLNDVMIEEIITEVFMEELNEGREVDDITDMLCESIDYTVSLLTEVTSPAKVNALRLKNKNKESESPKASKLDRVKSIAKKVGSKLRAGAVKGAEVAGKAAGHAKNLAKDMGSAAKKGYASTQSSSSSSSDSSDSSSSSSSDSSSSSESKPKKPGLLSRIGSKLKRGLKKAVGAGARAVSRGARNVARKLGEETVDLKKINDRIAKQGIQYPTGKKQKTSVALRKEKEMKKEEVIAERGDFWHPDPDKDKKLGGPGANQRAREDRASSSSSSSSSDSKKLRPGESYMDYSKRQKASSYKSSGSTARERLQKAGAKMSPPKERKRDKIGRAIGSAIDRVAGIKKEEVMSFGAFIKEQA